MRFPLLKTNVPDQFKAALKIVENDKEFDSKEIIPKADNLDILYFL